MNRVEQVANKGVIRDELPKSQKKLSDEFKDLLEKIASKVTVEASKAEKAFDLPTQSKISIRSKERTASESPVIAHDVSKQGAVSHESVAIYDGEKAEEVHKINGESDKKQAQSPKQAAISDDERESSPQQQDTLSSHENDSDAVEAELPSVSAENQFQKEVQSTTGQAIDGALESLITDKTPENMVFEEQAAAVVVAQQEIPTNPSIAPDLHKPVQLPQSNNPLAVSQDLPAAEELKEGTLPNIAREVINQEVEQDEVIITAKDLEVYFKLKDIQSKQKSPVEMALETSSPMSVQAVLQQLSTASDVVKSLTDSVHPQLGLKINKDSGFSPSISGVSADVRKSGVEREVRSRPLPRAHEARTMEKVESVLKEAVKAKDGKSITLRLDPPSLGAMRIDVGLKDGTLHAKLIPESRQVGNFLRDNAHELVISLRKLGLHVEKVTVSVVTEQGFESQEQAGSSMSFENKGEKENHSHDAHSGHEMPQMLPQDVQVVDSSSIDHWVA